MPTDNQEIEMPEGAEILTVQMQKTDLCLWAIVDPEAKKVKRKFNVFGTGHEIDIKGTYIGTFQMHGGDLIFHVFEIIG